MNFDYLKNELIPQREKEIEQGKNLSTRQPIYVVLELVERFVPGHSDYNMLLNEAGKDCEYGYIDNSLDHEDMVFKKSDRKMKKPIAVTRFYTDRVVAFFLTSKGAHDYLGYQAHNLRRGYVYVFYSGYGNKEMDMLLCGS